MHLACPGLFYWYNECKERKNGITHFQRWRRHSWRHQSLHSLMTLAGPAIAWEAKLIIEKAYVEVVYCATMYGFVNACKERTPFNNHRKVAVQAKEGAATKPRGRFKLDLAFYAYVYCYELSRKALQAIWVIDTGFRRSRCAFFRFLGFSGRIASARGSSSSVTGA